MAIGRRGGYRGDTLTFRRTGASGHIAVTEERIEVRVQIDPLLTPWCSRIEREIQAFCDEHFPGRPPEIRRREAV